MPKTSLDKPLLTAADKERYTKNPLALWRWKANPGACIDCTARDGRKYFYNDIPDRPHPNCKCTLEPVPDTTIQTAPPKATTPAAPDTTIAGVASEIYHDTGEALREIARAKLWKEAAENSYEAAKEIVNSEGWGDMATGTDHAIREVRSHPVAGPVLDSAIALEALALGYVAAPLVGELAPYAIMAPAYSPQITDFVSSFITTGPPTPSGYGYYGGFAGYVFDKLMEDDS